MKRKPGRPKTHTEPLKVIYLKVPKSLFTKWTKRKGKLTGPQLLAKLLQ